MDEPKNLEVDVEDTPLVGVVGVVPPPFLVSVLFPFASVICVNGMSAARLVVELAGDGSTDKA